MEHSSPRKGRKSVLPIVIVGLALLFITAAVRTFAPNVTEADLGGATGPSNLSGSSTVTISAVGDITVTQEILDAAYEGGAYDFTRCLLPVASLLAKSDLTVANLEAVVTGGRPDADNALAPASLVDALAQSGVDLVQTANSKAISDGLTGLQRTIDTIRDAGMEAVGTFADNGTFEQSGGITVVEKNGLKICFVAFTKGLDNMSLPEGSEHCVNLLYTDYATEYSQVDIAGITRVLRAAQSCQPDVTIALLHWGSEYVTDLSSTQTVIENLMFEYGVDAIIGTHSHVVGQMSEKEYDGRKVFVAYSLGNFLDYDTAKGANTGVVLNLTFTKNNYTGVTEFAGFTWDPVYMAGADESGQGRFQVLNLADTMTMYEDGYIHRVSQDAYEAMQAALESLNNRINPPVED